MKKNKNFLMGKSWMLFIMSSILMHLYFLCIPPFNASADVTEQDIMDAVLHVRTFTDEQLQEMDLNGDGVVDVADIVNFSKRVIAQFTTKSSPVDETADTQTISVTFSRPYTGNLFFTIGGTATAGEDYTFPTGSVEADGVVILEGRSIAVNGTNIDLAIPLVEDPDNQYEGNETIVVNLLPCEGYLLGDQRTHTINLADNPNATGADYLFILSSNTQGLSGDTTAQTGFPGTLFSRTASVHIVFSENSVLSAHINENKSIGISDMNPESNAIPASSPTSSPLRMVFEYTNQSESFVDNPSITTFDPDNPSLGAEQPKELTYTLTLTVTHSVVPGLNGTSTETPFNIATDKFTDKYLKGTFSLAISGILNEATTPFFEGSLGGTMQR